MNTSRKAIKVTDRYSLRREKARLKRLCREMEQEGQDRLDHVKQHYGTMALNSIFPDAHPETQFWKLIAYGAKSAWGSTRFKSVLISAAITFLEYIGVKGGVKLVEKLFSRNKDEKEGVKVEKEES